MLETFDWSDKEVFASADVQIVTLANPVKNALSYCRLGATFGVVLDGYCATVRKAGYSHMMGAESFFSVSGMDAELESRGGRVLLITAPFKDTPFLVGGPIEPRGRLRYIDGCTDTLLLSPWRLGEACLNLLHIPPHTEQTMHTHPTDRVGVILSGSGECVTPDGTTKLMDGMVWRIPAGSLHRFRTDGDCLRVVAWHPDSDSGPADDDHPMLSRSYVEGVSARHINEIRTR